MEREARFYSYAVALYGYLLYFSALANCNNILAGGAILAHLTDVVCIQPRLNMFRFSFFVSRFRLFSLLSLRRYARSTVLRLGAFWKVLERLELEAPLGSEKLRKFERAHGVDPPTWF